MPFSHRPVNGSWESSRKFVIYFVLLFCTVLSVSLLFAYSVIGAAYYLVGASLSMVSMCIASIFVNGNVKDPKISTNPNLDPSTDWGYHPMQSSINNGRYNIIDFAHNNNVWNHVQGWKEDHSEIKDFAHNNKAWAKKEEWKKNRF